MKRQYVIAAVAAVAVFLLYRWWKNRHYVLDPSNSTSLSNLFDQLNPTIGGAATPSAGTVAQNIAAGMPVSPQNFIPITRTGQLDNTGSFGPVTSPYPLGLQVNA